MTFTYFDMLCGEPLLLDGVGHVRSPKIKELKPPPLGVGERMYQFYLNILSWDRDALMEYIETCGIRGWDKIQDERFGPYEILTLLRPMRMLLLEMFSFFVVEETVWDERSRVFRVFTPQKEGDEPQEVEEVGIINRENFEAVRTAILELNYIGLDKNETPVTHSSEKSKQLWELAQMYLKEQAKQTARRDNNKYHLGNIVSKVCAADTSYSLFNVYDLTIFQLYDQFFQYSYLRSAALNENIFSNHGGDRFKADAWLNPLNKKF